MSVELAMIGLEGHKHVVLDALPGLPEVRVVAVAEDEAELGRPVELA